MTGMHEPDMWRTFAACRGMDPALFFPERGAEDDATEALAVCAECPVVEQCLKTAIHERDGIWGGTTGRQRRTLRSKLRRNGELPTPQPARRMDPTRPAAQCGSDSGYRKHLRDKTPVCSACLESHRRAARRTTTPRTDPIIRPICGQVRGYIKHHRSNEVACGPCLEAKRKASLETAHRVRHLKGL